MPAIDPPLRPELLSLVVATVLPSAPEVELEAETVIVLTSPLEEVV